MSRRRRAEKREIEPDPVYNSEVLARFINRVMLDGKKSTALELSTMLLQNFLSALKLKILLLLSMKLLKMLSLLLRLNPAVLVAPRTRSLLKLTPIVVQL